MTRQLTLEQVLRLARRAVDGPVYVRDLGLLDAAVHRPATTLFGQDAYPDLFLKSASLLQSLATNHPLVDGNKRLAWLATYTFLAKNGVILDAEDDPAYGLVIAVASGTLRELEPIREILASFPRLQEPDMDRRSHR